MIDHAAYWFATQPPLVYLAILAVVFAFGGVTGAWWMHRADMQALDDFSRGR